MELVAATVGDAAQLLDVQVDQLARPLALVADHDPAGPVGVGKPAHVMAAQHPIDRRAGAAAGGQHLTDLAAGRAWGQRRGREGRSASPAGPGRGSGPATCRRWPATPPRLSAAWAGGQPSSVMRWTSSSRPNSVRRALRWAMRVPSRLGVSTAQADRGDPQLPTTLVGTTTSAGSTGLYTDSGAGPARVERGVIIRFGGQVMRRNKLSQGRWGRSWPAPRDLLRGSLRWRLSSRGSAC
jgi:hypothetical protein